MGLRTLVDGIDTRGSTSICVIDPERTKEKTKPILVGFELSTS